MILKYKQSVLKIKKALTGINGLDAITDGGLPRNRTTVICGNAGCGKTVMSMEFLIHGAVSYNEPGVFMSFEESRRELITNMESFQFDLQNLVKKNKIYIEYLEVDASPIIEAGNYDLEGLFVRLKNAINLVGAKRVVLDSLDALFYGLNPRILRSEITRLFKWFKQNNITAIITAENNNNFNNSGLEQYVADCVVVLDNRTINQSTVRRLRIVKMRGSDHGNNEYPFVIHSQGISVLPLISELVNHRLSSQRISSGITGLDDMLDGKGFFQGSSIIVSGSAGTGKTSIAVALIHAASKRKIRCLYCAFEESTAQIIRNMHSIGLNVEPHIKSGMLQFYCSRPTLQNFELHLIAIQKTIMEYKPEVIVMDPITNLISEGINTEIRLMLTHFIDFLKGRNITSLLTAAITLETIKSNPSDEGISSMADTWILVRDIEKNSERNRGIYVLKSRGMSHSTQVREFTISDKGINILPTYITSEGVLTGSAKLEDVLKQEALDRALEIESKNILVEIARKRKIANDQISLLKTNLESEISELRVTKSEINLNHEASGRNKKEILALRNNLGKPKKSSAKN